MIEICAGITLYHPSDEDIENLVYYSGIFPAIYVFDNSETCVPCKYPSNVRVLSKGNNLGLSVACDKICRQAIDDGFKYVMLFDQDSRIDQDSLNNLFSFIVEKKIVASVYCPFVEFSGGDYPNSKSYEFVDWCITSGSVIALNEYGQSYCFDQNYFIDRLDKDFCKQIIKSNNKILRVNTCILHQRLGEGLRGNYSKHSAIRHYYIARNRVYYNKKYNKTVYKTCLQTIRHLICIFAYEDKKLTKVRMLIEGIIDAKREKYGKYNS